jgi:uncharacterized protein (DUF488 family)
MGIKHTILATIGYEGADVDDFVATLRTAGIRRLIDVRELAISRRRGFAKRALSDALTDAGIEYVHLRGLGDPKEGREAARAGDYTRFKKVFGGHLKTETAQADLRTAMRLVADGAACLMCFERDHTGCHRTIVAQALSDNMPLTIRHLGVRSGLANSRSQAKARKFSEERT